MKVKPVTSEIIADTKNFNLAMENLTKTTQEFGKVFASTITNAVKSGRGFDDIIKQIGLRLANLALKKAFGSLDNVLAGLVAGLGSAFSSSAGSRNAGSGDASRHTVVPFARGGIVTSPTLFGHGSHLGVMGEAGPEAILPLKRGNDGQLGVASGGSGPTATIVFNVQANDAESFRHSEAQLTTMLARAVSRGNRNL